MSSQSQHVWFLENIQAYLTQGLELAESSRFEQHLDECGECRVEFESRQAEDQKLQVLFASAQPAPGFEDRVMQRLRQSDRPRILLAPRSYKIAAGIAAVLILGGVGFLAEGVLKSGDLKLPNLARNEIAQVTPQEESEAFYLDAVQANAPLDMQVNLATDVEGLALLAQVEMLDLPQANALTNNLQNQVLYLPSGNQANESSLQDRAAGKNLSGSSHGGTFRGPGDIVPPGAELYSYRNDSMEPKAGLPVASKVAQEPKIARIQENKDDKKESGRVGLPVIDAGTGAGEKPGAKLADRNALPSEESKFQRKVIRNGDMEFEVDGFDSAYMQIIKIVMEEGGFVASTNSEKLANGKVRGTVVVRVSPDRLDVLVLKLRALGELKSQRITAQDITKAYTDLESQLRAARAMEERLIEMIKSGKGEIKDLLAAEKELGIWREKIEKIEGEVRYYNNLISLSTLNITLQEKEIKSPSSATETEKVGMGIETEDVEKSYAEALKSIAEAKGRITKSELKKIDANQFSAVIECEVSPEQAGVLQDRLKQLGHVARLDIGRSQTTQGGVGRPTGIPIERKETQFSISLYNLANVQAKEIVYLDLACPDVEEAFKSILSRIEQAKGRVLSSNLNRQKQSQMSATLSFEAVTAEAEALLSDIRLRGESLKFNIAENQDSNATRSKRGFFVQLYSNSMIAPRESFFVRVAAKDVGTAYHRLLQELQKLKGRVISSNLAEEDKNNISGNLDFEVGRADQVIVEALIATFGDTVVRRVTRAAEGETAIDSKVRLQLQMVNATTLAPRESTTLAIEVSDVEPVIEKFQALTQKNGGRVLESHVSRDKSGRVVSKIVIDVPLSASISTLEEIRRAGTVRVAQSQKNPQVPDGSLARARIELTVANPQIIVPSDQNVVDTVQKGLANSFAGLMWSLNLVVIGICLIGPWLLIGWIGLKIFRRKKTGT